MTQSSESRPALSPSELNREARTLLESHFDFVWVEGEVSNFARPASGHWYFSLKDDRAQVRCAMFRNRNQRLRHVPKNGDQVRLRARVSLYEGRGEFQLIGEFLEPAGAGALQARFEALRDRLRAEGLFDGERKRALPAEVRHLAVVSSPSGAALQDILQVLQRRNPSIRVTVLAASVQGEAAAGELRRAVERANRLAALRPDCDFDALIVARGGGSLEDLWAFNDEALARTIAASKLPVVVGVGHEVDVTIADFAADQRAPTPSAAAEILSEDREEQLRRLSALRQQLRRGFRQNIRRGQLRIHSLAARLRHPGERLREQSQRLDDADLRLRSALRRRLQQSGQQHAALKRRLRARSPLRGIDSARRQMQASKRGLEGAARRRLERERAVLRRYRELLDSLNPLAILTRGYAILSDEQGRALRDAGEAAAGQQLRARLAQGELSLEVLKTKTEEP
ncbi:MAG: exodeoxyribonuclease VII large subunit [Halieaceae bacterium]|jgi:exodeoxyribonuclease VII large subunit|nr:exodeoxyribonuclease VII large subunit [Halieaceae bacterium]